MLSAAIPTGIPSDNFQPYEITFSIFGNMSGTNHFLYHLFNYNKTGTIFGTIYRLQWVGQKRLSNKNDKMSSKLQIMP